MQRYIPTRRNITAKSSEAQANDDDDLKGRWIGVRCSYAGNRHADKKEVPKRLTDCMQYGSEPEAGRMLE
jgi:hypothetical protein